MHNNSSDRLFAVLEPVRELLRYVEQLPDIESNMPRLCEHVLELRLSVDREIEVLRDVAIPVAGKHREAAEWQCWMS